METVSIFQWTMKVICLENNDGNENDSKMTMKMTMTLIISMTKAMNMTIKLQ